MFAAGAGTLAACRSAVAGGSTSSGRPGERRSWPVASSIAGVRQCPDRRSCTSTYSPPTPRIATINCTDRRDRLVVFSHGLVNGDRRSWRQRHDALCRRGSALGTRSMERDRRRAERRTTLYIELMADVLQRRGLLDDWADTYDGPSGDEPLRSRRWNLLGDHELALKSAELEIIGHPAMRSAWGKYCEAVDRLSWSADVNAEWDTAAGNSVRDSTGVVLAVGRQQGVA